jgi:hypothetical protein
VWALGSAQEWGPVSVLEWVRVWVPALVPALVPVSALVSAKASEPVLALV